MFTLGHGDGLAGRPGCRHGRDREGRPGGEAPDPTPARVHRGPAPRDTSPERPPRRLVDPTSEDGLRPRRPAVAARGPTGGASGPTATGSRRIAPPGARWSRTRPTPGAGRPPAAPTPCRRRGLLRCRLWVRKRGSGGANLVTSTGAERAADSTSRAAGCSRAGIRTGRPAGRSPAGAAPRASDARGPGRAQRSCAVAACRGVARSRARAGDHQPGTATRAGATRRPRWTRAAPGSESRLDHHPSEEEGRSARS